MRKLFLAVLMLLVLSVPANAFQVGDYKISNTIKALKIFDDTDYYEMRGEHLIRISKKGSPLWVQNLYQRDFAFAGEDKEYNGDSWQNRSTVGVDINTWSSILVERQEYSFRQSGKDDILYRTGLELRF